MSRQKIAKLFIGLMSGTSLDGVDCVIIDFENNHLVATNYLPYHNKLKNKLQNVVNATPPQIAELDTQIAHIFSECVNQILANSNLKPEQIIAIGSHGHTIYHIPKKYSWQIGNGMIIKQKTGITTVCNFRNNDIAMGGQGAPLTPKYHQYLLNGDGIVVNLGGFANITKITGDTVIGFDSGPANTLINNFMLKANNIDYDKNGLFARSGIIIQDLLRVMLADNYFALNYPKSTSVEYFNLNWLSHFLIGNEKTQDVMRTLVELSAISISKYLNDDRAYICGGGVHNLLLIERLQFLNPKCEILTTDKLGVGVDFVEAAAFAYFAKLRLEDKTANIPSVTGAKQEVLLGVVNE